MKFSRTALPVAALLAFAGCSEGGVQLFEPEVERSTETSQSPQFSHSDGPLVSPTLNPGGSGNPTCSEAMGSGWTGLGPRINFGSGTNDQFPQEDGTYNVNFGGLTGTVTLSGGARFVAFQFSAPIDGFIVKGGPNANLYDYRPINGTDHDNGLRSPDHPSAGQIPGVSHVDICFAPKLSVSKTANTSFKRTWTWDVAKSAVTDPHPIPESFGEGDVLGVNYTVTFSATSVDSHWAVSGNITIHNPWNEAAQITAVSDVITPGDLAASVTCPGGIPQALAAGGTLVCTYSRSLPDATNRTNTATVTTSGSIGGGQATAPVDFGSATITQIDRCADVKDILSVNGIAVETVTDTQLCANVNGSSFQQKYEYSRSFGEGAISLECDDNTITNVASFKTVGTGATGSANTSIEIFVICEVPEEPQEETAWAANGDVPGSLRYTPRGDWATYVQYTGAAKTTTFFAGQTIDVGRVTFSAPSGGMVTITIELHDGWSFAAGEVVAVQGYASAPSGNPAPGLFAHKGPASGTSFSIQVPQANFYGVHGVVAK
jgi:hypothetical protein